MVPLTDINRHYLDSMKSLARPSGFIGTIIWKRTVILDAAATGRSNKPFKNKYIIKKRGGDRIRVVHDYSPHSET